MDSESTRPMKMKLADIHCPNCGAAAKFDIVMQRYLCGYCGSAVFISEACREKEGFRKLHGNRLKNEVAKMKLTKTTCSGCGAEVVFEEGEALTSCPFCDKSLVRAAYLKTDGLPESVIPFVLTEDEARDMLQDFCKANRRKREAKHLRPLINDLKGFYLPYELVRGPVHMTVSRMDGGGRFFCEGFINNEFINRSKQLDNLLLDGMEPFDTDALTAFDFAYVAGHRVKIPDIPEKVLESRVSEEVSEAYTPAVRKTLESRAVTVDADVSSAVRLPVLLPVYYICKGNLMAAVNGQTGKVSVRAEKESHYYFLPWWLKAILAVLAVSLVVFASLRLFGMAADESLLLTGMLAIVLLIVMLCLYSDTTRNRFKVESGRKIYTSGGHSYHREQGQLIQDEKVLERKTVEPIFFKKIEGEVRPVILRFTTPARIIRMAASCIAVLFLPVIIALFLNGFDFARLELGGSAVWFCIMLPVVPVYLVKFGIVEFYEKPWIYLIREDGKKKRYRKKFSFKIDMKMIGLVLRALFVPPISLAVWFAIACFITMCYLTAFGFD